MKTGLSIKSLFPLAILTLALVQRFSAGGQTVNLLSDINPVLIPAGGGGGSFWPIASPDGRYVVFASSAADLCVVTNGLPIPGRIPAPLNVYLRDRLYGTNMLASPNVSGVASGNGDSVPAGVTPDGRYVVFESSASDLVPYDTNMASDVFVHDLVAGSTILVSATTGGVPGNGASRSPVISPDGRYVAFVSAATNLVDRDTNKLSDVFVRDLQNNVTVLASVGAISTSLTAGSEAPTITDDGRFVAFYSTATNLVPGVPAGGDIYIRDLVAGTTAWASTNARTIVRSNSVTSFSHAFSADGRYLAYQAAGSTALSGTVLRYRLDTALTDVVGTNATVTRAPFDEIHSVDISSDGRFIAYVANLYTTDGTTTCIKLWDAQSGQSTIVSSNLTVLGIPQGSVCDWPNMDSSGRYVAFLSSSTNMVTNAVAGEFHLYLRDTQEGTTKLLDAGVDGVGVGISPATAPRLAADASFVVFECADANLVPGDMNREVDVFFRDLRTDAVELISARDSALPAATPAGPSTLTPNSVSSDGRYVAFASSAENIVTNDNNGYRDIFVRDLVEGATRLVSTATNGLSADGMSSEPAISPDGRYVVFSSLSDNLATGASSRYQNVYLSDLQSATTALVSVKPGVAGGSGNNNSYSPLVSTGGRFVLFWSKATDLATGPYSSGSVNLFLRDLQSATNYALTTAGVVSASMTPNGRYVAYTDTPGNSRYYLWDTEAAARIATNSTALGLLLLAISPDGNRVAYWAGSGVLSLYVEDRLAGTNGAITSSTVPLVSTTVLRFSTDSQVLTYTMSLSGTNQVYRYDFRSGANLLVSSDWSSGLPANGPSDSPVVSGDGRFIAYRSAAANIAPGDNNGVPDIFLFDSQTGLNTLLSAAQPGAGFPINRSLTPVFSADGGTLVFASWASDLVPRDFNHGSDIFAHTLLTAVLLPASSLLGDGPWISWPWSAGRNYRVEYKDALTASAWQEISGTITNIGTRAWMRDPAPAPGQRFYRVRAF